MDGQQIERSFEIRITASVRGRSDLSATASFNFVVKNPCVDENYVTLIKPQFNP